MILVRISLEYKGIPFEIEINGQGLSSLEALSNLLEQIKNFIDKMLEKNNWLEQTKNFIEQFN